MASNEQDFSQNEGGAMLTPDNNAQPSFDNEEETEVKEEIGEETKEKASEEAVEAEGTTAVTAVLENKKKSIGLKVIGAFAPVFAFIGHALVLGIILLVIIALVGSKLGFITKLLSFDSTAVAEYLEDMGTDVLSGRYFYQIYLSVSLPNYGYVDERTKGLSGDAEKEKRDEEIKKVSKIIAAIGAPAIYYDTSSDNEIKLSEISSLSDVANFFGQGEVYRIVAESACMLAYSGLKDPNGRSYFENKIGSEITNSSGYAQAWDKVKNDECNESSGVGNKFNVDTIGKNFLSGIGSKSAGDVLKSLYNDLYGNLVTGTDNKMNKSLLNHIDNYEFDDKTYENFLKNYYGNALLGELKNSEIKLDEFVSGVVSMQSSLESTAIENLKEHYRNLSGAGYGLTLMDTLGSMYGNSKCAILEEYNPLTHEYIVGKSLEGDEIHSVSDGEVVEVTYNGENIYSKYDSNTGKCLCNGNECENSNGSEVKIKFIYDEIEYMAIYSNLAEIRVDVGDKVKKGDIIATEGNTGCANTKKLTFKIISESGISYNPNELMQRCSSYTNTSGLCNLQNIKINLHNCDNELIKTMNFYDYVKEEIYSNFKSGLENEEFLKAATLIVATKTLKDNNYKIGTTEIEIKNCKYMESEIKENPLLDRAISSVIGEVITYVGDFANIKYSNTCNRTEKDKNANSVYNELCINEAAKMKKTYKEILKIYYPSFSVNENYCSNYASKINAYSIQNDKNALKRLYMGEEIERMNTNLKSKIEASKIGTRAATVEAARFLTLGLKEKIPYKNGGKYFEEGINQEWYKDGLDSSGFVSWALKNGHANIDKTMTSKELISNLGSLKIGTDLYKYYDKIQVGDFAYNDSKIGIVIGKKDGILYVAESDSEKGLIATTITSYGESESKYTHIYYADDYYNGVGNITSMW